MTEFSIDSNPIQSPIQSSFQSSILSSQTISLEEYTNSIYFNGRIDNKTMSELINKLKSLENIIIKKQRKIKRKFNEFKNKNNDLEEDEEQFDIKIEPKPITLYITTLGGYVTDVFAAIDIINRMTIPVNTVCIGMVASAGTLLSLAGSKRYITENSYMLIHELRSGYWGKLTTMIEQIENSQKIMDQIKLYYLNKIKMTSEELNEQLKKDAYWDAKTCLEKGLVDEILTSNIAKK